MSTRPLSFLRAHRSLVPVVATLVFTGCTATEGGPVAAHTEALTWEQRTTLWPNDATEITQFGFDLDTDGARVAVGTPFTYGVDNTEAGTIWIYRLEDDGTYTEEVRFRPFAERAYLRFGWSVAIDGTRAVAGMPGGYPDAAVAVLERDASGTWDEVVRLAPSTFLSDDEAGSVVGLSGDVLVVASGKHDVDLDRDTGTVWAFVRRSGTWVEEAVLLGSQHSAFGGFGTSLAFEGSRLVVGAPAEATASGTGAGVVYVFERTEVGGIGVWTEAARLSPSTTIDGFGETVALTGDRIVVGSPSHADYTGTAHVFVRSAEGAWSEEAHLAFDAAVEGDEIGTSLAVEGDRVAVGGVNHVMSGRTGAGAVWIFQRTGSSWALEQIFSPRTVVARAALGTSVLLQDGLLYASATGETHGGADGFGTVYVVGTGDPSGTECTSSSGCASGVCIDGVCCATECGTGDGDCEACSIAAGGSVDGVCTAVASGTLCRDLAGTCDVVEVCDGTSRVCPGDVVQTIGVECRAAADVCDVVERCDGTSATCPADGATIPGCCATASDCDDRDPCTTDACESGSTCTHTAIAGCTIDAGVGRDAGGGSSGDGGVEDGGVVRRDAGRVDAGTGGGGGGDGSGSGCGCHAGATSTSPFALAGLAGLLGVVARRRRR